MGKNPELVTRNPELATTLRSRAKYVNNIATIKTAINMTTYMKDSKAPPRARGNPLQDQKVRRSEDQNEEGRKRSGERQLAVGSSKFTIYRFTIYDLPVASGKQPEAKSQPPVTACGGSKPVVTWVKPPGAPGRNTFVPYHLRPVFSGGRLLLFKDLSASTGPDNIEGCMVYKRRPDNIEGCMVYKRRPDNIEGCMVYKRRPDSTYHDLSASAGPGNVGKLIINADRSATLSD